MTINSINQYKSANLCLCTKSKNNRLRMASVTISFNLHILLINQITPVSVVVSFPLTASIIRKTAHGRHYFILNHISELPATTGYTGVGNDKVTPGQLE